MGSRLNSESLREPAFDIRTGHCQRLGFWNHFAILVKALRLPSTGPVPQRAQDSGRL
jgi:hypothetical protein